MTNDKYYFEYLSRGFDVKNIFSGIDLVGFYPLVEEYDSDMGRLHADLKKLMSEKFNGGPINFEPNERLVFLHNDGDIFLNNSPPGFTLYNLQLILKDLNIPNCFCVVISNIPKYTEHVELVNRILTSDPTPMTAISSHYFNMLGKINPIDTNIELITKPFMVLSRLARFHRTYFMSKLFNANLENSGFVAYHNIDAKQDGVDTDYAPNVLVHPLNLIYTIPFNRYNTTEYVIRSSKNQEIFKKFVSSVPSYVNFKDSVNISDKEKSMDLQNNVLYSSLIYVGIEPTIQYPEVYIDEVAWKGILAKRPFILFAVPGTIKYLQSLGIKTFGEFWDEGYDDIVNFEDRVDAIISILNHYKNFSSEDLQQLFFKMQNIVEYNFHHLNDNLINSEKLKIINGLT